MNSLIPAPITSLDWAQWFVAVGTLLAVIIALLIAIFQDKLRGLVMRPKLELSIRVAPPDCIKIPINRFDKEGNVIVTVDSYYFRFKVSNEGNTKADLVEVFCKSLHELQADGSFKEVTSFIPMRLTWVPAHETTASLILNNTYKHCNLGHIIDPSLRLELSSEDKRWANVSEDETIFSFNTEVMPTNLSHLVAPGKYRLTIILAAVNSKPLERTIEINLTGKGFNDIDDMFQRGIGITLH